MQYKKNLCAIEENKKPIQIEYFMLASLQGSIVAKLVRSGFKTTLFVRILIQNQVQTDLMLL